MHVCTLVGARPQFVKSAIVSRALHAAGIRETLIHSGQHYDEAMSRVFFDELDIPAPDVNLGVGSASHAEQTGNMMTRLEAYLQAQPTLPEVLVVYGDTNSTVAGALVAAKLGIPLAHVEAGLRSFNRRMPEEINRIITDRLSTLLFCPSQRAVELLAEEGITAGVHFTGDVMYDAVLHFQPLAAQRYPLHTLIPFEAGSYDLATVHRAANTDTRERLETVLALLGDAPRPIVWPMHPRTRNRIATFALTVPTNVHVLAPVGYLQMLTLLQGARYVLTDSGGLQKEAYWMKRPCITLRTETEWTETLAGGWNRVADLDRAAVSSALHTRPTEAPEAVYGAGDAGPRIARLLLES